MIDQATVDRIMDAAQIVEVVSEFVTLRKRGVNYTGLCPFHNEKSPSFSVSPSKGICKCFSCGKGGNVVHFIMEHEQLSYYEALKYLARKYNIEVKEREFTDEEKQAQSERENMFVLNTFAQEYFARLLFQDTEGRSVGLSYFHERGFRDDIITKFQLGYSLDQRDALSAHATRNGFRRDTLLKTGLSLENQNNQLYDRFRGRVIFPIHSLSGKVLGFGGRILKKDEKLAKYMNSPESDIYHKSNELYGLFFAKRAIEKHDCCFMVEGYTDVLSMHQSGIENVVASSGTALTPGQIRLIHRFTNNITVIYDGDAAGIKASLRGIDLILKEGMNVKVLLLPDGEDPDSFSRKQNAASFIRYIADNETNFIHFKTTLLMKETEKDPVKRAELITDIIRSIGYIPDKIVRTIFIKEVSQLMGIDELIILNEVAKLKLNMAEQESMARVELSPATQTPPPTAESNPVATSAQGAALTSIPAVSAAHAMFYSYELSLLRYVVRYGEQIIFEYTDEETNEETRFNVIDYILQDLAIDDIEFNHPLYKRMMDEAAEASKKENFCAERFFLSHPDPQISKLTVELISEKYTLSKIYSKYQEVEEEKDKLAELVPRSIFELKDAMIDKEIRDLKKQIKADDYEQAMALMKQIGDLKEIKSELAKQIGFRVIKSK